MPPTGKLSFAPYSSGVHITLYRPCYGGYHSSSPSVMFMWPSEALVWGVTRFKKDGLANCFGPRKYPKFLRHVFELSVRKSDVIYIEMPFNGKPSKDEQAFFDGTAFYTIAVDTELLSYGYLLCEKDKFMTCCESLLSPTQDYHSSSKSIYLKDAVCPLFHSNFYFERNGQLSSM